MVRYSLFPGSGFGFAFIVLPSTALWVLSCSELPAIRCSRIFFGSFLGNVAGIPTLNPLTLNPMETLIATLP